MLRKMANTLDLDAYLGRINYAGPRTPTYETLAGILTAHVTSIPFEIFDVHLGRPFSWIPKDCTPSSSLPVAADTASNTQA